MSRVFTDLRDVTKQDSGLELKVSRVFINLRDVTKQDSGLELKGFH